MLRDAEVIGQFGDDAQTTPGALVRPGGLHFGPAVTAVAYVNA